MDPSWDTHADIVHQKKHERIIENLKRDVMIRKFCSTPIDPGESSNSTDDLPATFDSHEMPQMEVPFLKGSPVVTMASNTKSWSNDLDDLRYPLVNVYIANWKDPPFLMGKSTINGHVQLLC